MRVKRTPFEIAEFLCRLIGSKVLGPSEIGRFVNVAMRWGGYTPETQEYKEIGAQVRPIFNTLRKEERRAA